MHTKNLNETTFLLKDHLLNEWKKVPDIRVIKFHNYFCFTAQFKPHERVCTIKIKAKSISFNYLLCFYYCYVARSGIFSRIYSCFYYLIQTFKMLENNKLIANICVCVFLTIKVILLCVCVHLPELTINRQFTHGLSRNKFFGKPFSFICKLCFVYIYLFVWYVVQCGMDGRLNLVVSINRK